MKYIDVNKKFTEKISEYIGRGYILNSSSMGGSQGERAHVDLTDGSEVIRVMVCNLIDDRDARLNGIEVIVGRSTDNVLPNADDSWHTLWSSHLDVISRDAFYEIGESRNGSKFYGSREDALAARTVRCRRWDNTRSKNAPAGILDAKRREIAVSVVRNRLGLRRVNADEVKLTKSAHGYTVSYHGKSVNIH